MVAATRRKQKMLVKSSTGLISIVCEILHAEDLLDPSPHETGGAEPYPFLGLWQVSLLQNRL